MKRWQIIGLSAAISATAAYFYFYRGFRPFASHNGPSDSISDRPAAFQWQPINRPDVGFCVDMPSETIDGLSADTAAART